MYKERPNTAGAAATVFTEAIGFAAKAGGGDITDMLSSPYVREANSVYTMWKKDATQMWDHILTSSGAALTEEGRRRNSPPQQPSSFASVGEDILQFQQSPSQHVRRLIDFKVTALEQSG